MVERHKLYNYDYNSGKISFVGMKCPRCGRVMANHKDRFACGFCGYTIYNKG
ncbi:MAG: 30S ribosomal protein S27ae [Candidatus Methanomethylicia archaeon]